MAKSIKKLPHTKRVYKKKKKGGSQHYWTGRRGKSSKIGGWRQDPAREKGYGWRNDKTRTYLMIHEGQFGEHVVSAWTTRPKYKGLLRRKFDTLPKAQSFAKAWMQRHPNPQTVKKKQYTPVELLNALDNISRIHEQPITGTNKLQLYYKTQDDILSGKIKTLDQIRKIFETKIKLLKKNLSHKRKSDRITGWKLVRDNKFQVLWENRNPLAITDTVQIISYIEKKKGVSKEVHNVIRSGSYKSGNQIPKTIKNGLKTRNDAHNVAISWMREHPNG